MDINETHLPVPENKEQTAKHIIVVIDNDYPEMIVKSLEKAWDGENIFFTFNTIDTDVAKQVISCNPDLVIIDNLLEHSIMDGDTGCKELRRLGYQQAILLISADPPDLSTAQKFGANAVYRKIYRKGTFVNLLEVTKTLIKSQDALKHPN